MSTPLTPPPMTRERIQHVYDTHVGDPTEKLPHTPTDWEDFAQAVATARDAQWAARVAELQRDATRYRWLRAAWLADPDAGEDVAWSPIMHSCDEAGMNADIDSAIRSSEGKGAEG